MTDKAIEMIAEMLHKTGDNLELIAQGKEPLYNSNITKEGIEGIIDSLNIEPSDDRMSLAQTYSYLNMSRATFMRNIKAGKIPKGKKIKGWKELYWSKKELDIIIKNNNYGNNKRHNKGYNA